MVTDQWCVVRVNIHPQQDPQYFTNIRPGVLVAQVIHYYDNINKDMFKQTNILYIYIKGIKKLCTSFLEMGYRSNTYVPCTENSVGS